MKNILSLFLIGVAGFKLATSFINPEEIVTLFGAEINVWLYRGIWLFAGLLAVYSIKRNQTNKNN